jgi:hypothetical protein
VLDYKVMQNFADQTVYLPDLARDSPIIGDATFERCTIRGPAIVFLMDGNTLDGNRFGLAGGWSSALWLITDDRPHVVGVIGLQRCVFRQCNFEGIGIAGRKEFLRKMQADTDLTALLGNSPSS